MTQPTSNPYQEFAAPPVAPAAPVTAPQTTSTTSRSPLLGIFLVVAGILLAVAEVVLAYVLIRWAPNPLEWFLGTTLAILVLLAILAVVAGGRRALSGFVAIALLLPFLSTISAAAGFAERVDEEISSFWGGDDGPSFDLGDFGFGDDSDTDSVDAEAGAESAIPLGETGTAGPFEIEVSGVECTTTLRNAADNPEFFTSDDAEEFLDVKAEKGEQFCVISSTWKNASKEPNSADGWNSFAKIVDAEGNSFAPSDDDYAYSARVASEAGIDSGVLNPGASTEVRNVFSVPANSDFTHAVVDVFDAELSTLWFEIS